MENINARGEGDLRERVKNADGLLLLADTPVTYKTICEMARCKGIVQISIGFDNIDLRAAGEKGIVVSNTPDYCIWEVADTTLGLILALTRRFVVFDRSMRKGS